MINFTWKFDLQKIVPYDVNTSNINVIKTLSWVIVATDLLHPNKQASISGCVDFDISTINNFIPIHEITNHILQSWIENRVGVNILNEMKFNLETQLNNLPDNWNPVPNI